MQRDDYREDLPVSRGQWRAIAEQLLRLQGEPDPASRMDATVLLARLAAAEPTHDGARPVVYMPGPDGGPPRGFVEVDPVTGQPAAPAGERGAR